MKENGLQNKCDLFFPCRAQLTTPGSGAERWAWQAWHSLEIMTDYNELCKWSEQRLHWDTCTVWTLFVSIYNIQRCASANNTCSRKLLVFVVGRDTPNMS